MTDPNRYVGRTDGAGPVARDPSCHNSRIGAETDREDPKTGEPAADRRRTMALVGFASVVAALVRLPLVIAEGFPLGDGGLFLAVLRTMLSGGGPLPDGVVFNGETLPFAYPPLGFWLGAAFARSTGLDPIEALRWVPLAFSIATAAVFALLARDLLGRDTARPWIAVAVFALLPRSYVWPLMGGGLTRSPGFFFALMALLLSGRACRSERRGIVGTALALGAACLTHPEWGITAGVAVALRILLWKPPAARRLRTMTLVGVGAAALGAPWLSTILVRHGAEPFQAALATGAHSVSSPLRNLLDLGFLRTEYLSLSPALVATIGGVALLFRGEALAPAWLAAISFTTPRHGATPAVAALSLLVAEGFATLAVGLCVRWPQLARIGARSGPLAVAIAGLWLALALPSGEATHPPELKCVSPETRRAMQWIRERTPPRSTFVILSPGGDWYSDIDAEWFPALAERRSATTAQGLEWRPAGAFRRRVEEIRRLKILQAVHPERLGGVLRSEAGEPLHVAVFLPGTDRSWGGFLASGRWDLVLDAPGALIWRERPRANEPSSPSTADSGPGFPSSPARESSGLPARKGARGKPGGPGFPRPSQ